MPAPLGWALRLRWLLLGAQVAVVVLSRSIFGARMSLPPALVVIAVGTLANLALWPLRARRVSERGLALLLGSDVVLLTALLFITGGAFNPFSLLYFVPLAIAPVMLSPAWTWSLLTFAAASYAFLFTDPAWLSRALRVEALSHADQMRIHVRGMWIAFVLAAVFIAAFVGRLQADRARAADALASLRGRQARADKLAALGTLAAGAAHELSTPLSTIAVVAKELQVRLAALGDEEARADAELVRSEVARCRAVLDRLAADAGSELGERATVSPLAKILDEACDGLPPTPPIDVELAERVVVCGPPRSLALAIRGLMKNAQQAQRDQAPAPIAVRARSDGGVVRIEVIDRGVGMSADVLARAGEPFFTTKEQGQGMGLGLFLARSLVERCGGALDVRSTAGVGTTVSLLLRAEPPREGALAS
jgi:two-component system sensor histidine kinase RegB